MGLFKGLTASKERQKAKAFYEKALHLTGNPREIRRIKAIIGNRTKAFFDMTFVEGAKKTEAHQQAVLEAKATGKSEPQAPFSSAYKQVKTLSGTIWVYIPQQITNRIFELGSKYQLELVTKGQALEVGQSIADDLTNTLELDHPIEALAFLAEPKTTLSKEESEVASESDDHQTDISEESPD